MQEERSETLVDVVRETGNYYAIEAAKHDGHSVYAKCGHGVVGLEAPLSHDNPFQQKLARVRVICRVLRVDVHTGTFDGARDGGEERTDGGRKGWEV